MRLKGVETIFFIENILSSRAFFFLDMGNFHIGYHGNGVAVELHYRLDSLSNFLPLFKVVLHLHLLQIVVVNILRIEHLGIPLIQ